MGVPKGTPSKRKGRKFSPNDWIHVTIWCRPDEWDKLNYLSASSTKSVSTWIVDKVYNYSGVVKELEYTEKVSGKVKPLCVPAKEWGIIKERADKCGMSISKYVLSIALS